MVESLFAICAVLVVGFLINIPIFVIWASFKKPTKEALLYNVFGKYSYLNVIRQIGLIENQLGRILKRERLVIERMYNVCKKRKIPFKRFRKKIHRLLKEVAFGKSMLAGAWHRMDAYPKVVAVWDLLILLSIMNLTATALWTESNSYFAGTLIGNILGFFIGAIVWFFCHIFLNSVIGLAAAIKMDKKGNAGYLHEVSAQFYGLTKGYLWRDLYWGGGYTNTETATGHVVWGAFTVGGFGTSGSDFGGFGGGSFGGGGAGGDW